MDPEPCPQRLLLPLFPIRLNPLALSLGLPVR